MVGFVDDHDPPIVHGPGVIEVQSFVEVVFVSVAAVPVHSTGAAAAATASKHTGKVTSSI